MAEETTKLFTPRRDPTSPYRRKRLLAFWAARLGFLRILRRSWRFLILRWGLSPLGWSWGFQGYHWGAFLGVFGTLRRPWGALGVIFWASGGPPGRFQRAVASKDPCTKLASRHFKRFWSQTGPQKVPNMELKSIKNRFKNLSKFWSFFQRSLEHFCEFWECCWGPGSSKMSVWCGRGAIFRKFTFFMPDSVLDWFFNDLLQLWERFWEPKWCQNQLKN